ncbi:unnamed protein product [Mesocestoides corti]|uniref:Uncharacterized protein n=1 Tax=Mesocestoides corti TaxID=53468 RepID=A0A0R3U9N9_MESCO|nr:unnamed protein product [Mesocestoides corti]
MLRPSNDGNRSFFAHAQDTTKLTPSSTDPYLCSEFSSDLAYLEKTVDAYPEPGPKRFLHECVSDVLPTATKVQQRKLNVGGHFRVVIITDGGCDDYYTPQNATSTTESIAASFNSITCIIVSLSDSEISPEVSGLRQTFRDFLVISGSSCIKEPKNADVNMSDALTAALLQTQRCDFTGPAFVACGHLCSVVSLTPPLCLKNLNDPGTSLSQLFVEVFGFLNVTDISHPPISSRHTLVELEGHAELQTEGLLCTILAALSATTTVGMVNVYLQPRTKKPSVFKILDENPQHIKYPDGRVFLTHGFISRFSSKRDCLMLSLFPEDCKGLPWLGQFDFLAPVSDFAGPVLFNSAEYITPFPVREAENLSYKPSDNSDFQYVDWVHAPNGPTNDIGKILRLSKRLPEKSDLFFKELTRLKAAALALGWPDLLVTLKELLMENLQYDPDNHHAKEISNILTIDRPQS